MILSIEAKQAESREVVRLATSRWSDKRGIHSRRSLLFMRRKSAGWQLLEEDSKMIGEDEVVSHIVNLDECKDGLYVVTTCNEYTDWESGMLEDYDYKLIPFTP